MNLVNALVLLNLIATGLLAGGEFMVWAGLRTPMASLEQAPHIRLRQALIRRLRILVPAVFFLAAASGAGLLFLAPDTSGSSHPRLVGEAALAAFILVALAGTVPINQAVLAWDPIDPPTDWAPLIRRWERLDLVRCVLAAAAFVAFILAVTTGTIARG